MVIRFINRNGDTLLERVQPFVPREGESVDLLDELFNVQSVLYKYEWSRDVVVFVELSPVFEDVR